MTNEQAKKMLKAKLECLKRETSGTDIDCNCRNCDECNLCYEQGNMGEQKEALDMVIKALEQEPILDKIFYIVHPLSIMSTSELEHKAIMQIAEMLEPLCLPESEDQG